MHRQKSLYFTFIIVCFAITFSLVAVSTASFKPAFTIFGDQCPAGKTWQFFENRTRWYVRLMYDDNILVSREFPEVFPATSETVPTTLMRCMRRGLHQFHFQAQNGDRTFAVWNFELEITESNAPIVITEASFSAYPWWGRANRQINIVQAGAAGTILTLGITLGVLLYKRKWKNKKA